VSCGKRPLERKNLSEERSWGGRRGVAALFSLA
jgi:hypothetical protein